MAEERSDVELEDETPAETEQIREQIEETRSQMGETIDAIQDKLSFANISEQVSEHVNNAVETAKDAVYEATVNKVTSIMKNISDGLSSNTVVRTVRTNPFPFILIGAGAGLLAYQAYSGGSNSNRRGNGRLSSGKKSLASATAPTPEGDGVTDKITDVAGSAYERVSGAVGSAYTGAGDAVGAVYDKAGRLTSAARGQYETYLEDNPLVLGAVALAVGAAVGMAIPATQYEGEMLGETRQRLLDKAGSTATGLIDRVSETVSRAGDMISEQTEPETMH